MGPLINARNVGLAAAGMSEMRLAPPCCWRLCRLLCVVISERRDMRFVGLAGASGGLACSSPTATTAGIERLAVRVRSRACATCSDDMPRFTDGRG